MQHSIFSPRPFRSLYLECERIVHMWYHLTAPPEPPASTPLFQREVTRRGRIISLMTLVTIAMVLLAYLVRPPQQEALIFLVVICLDLTALIYNRYGKILTAGIIITATTEGGLLVSLIICLILRHGISFDILNFLPVFVQAIVIAISALPLLWALGVFLFNCLIMSAVLVFVPYSPSLINYMHANPIESFTSMLICPFIVFIMTTFVSLIWVRSANDAIKRADRADALAEYEQKMAQKDREANEQLKCSLAEIAFIVACISNDPTKEFHLDEHNRLWPMATSLNNLRRRLITVNFEVCEYQQTLVFTDKLIRWLDSAITQNSLPTWLPSHTVIDEVVFRIRMLLWYQQSLLVQKGVIAQ